MTPLRIYLEGEMLATARAGQFNIMSKIAQAARRVGLRPEWRDEADFSPDRGGFALRHMKPVTRPHILSLRRAYHFPFWTIEPTHERWNFHVAHRRFDPAAIDRAEARAFQDRLRARILPGVTPTAGDFALIPLQGMIQERRPFQMISPLDMVEQVARTGRPCVATLHPSEHYLDDDLAALDRLAGRYANLRIGGDTARLLPRCAYVVTMNSSVAFNGFILNKPAVLCAKIDFHHIGYGPQNLLRDKAIVRRPLPFARYLFWFLRVMAINGAAGDVEDQIITAWRRGGWPV